MSGKSPRSSWFWSVPVALMCLLVVDAALALWRPSPARLPEQFSPAYLQRVVDAQSGTAPVVFLGDSVLWGYRLPASYAAATILRDSFAARPFFNGSYEGGSSANSYFMLRLLLERGVRPALVVLNVNSKEMNSADSAYRRLQPSLETDVAPYLDAADRARLELQPEPAFSGRLDAAAASIWRLYRYRTDLREAMFGTDDLATWTKNTVAHFTGSEALQAIEHRPTAARFLGTYDLAPLAPDNVDYVYLRKLAALLHERHIPALAFLTPTNHRLLHDYIDVPNYDARLVQIAQTLRSSGATVVNLDRAFATNEFLDNDHLTAAGNQRLASLLEPYLRRMLGP